MTYIRGTASISVHPNSINVYSTFGKIVFHFVIYADKAVNVSPGITSSTFTHIHPKDFTENYNILIDDACDDVDPKINAVDFYGDTSLPWLLTHSNEGFRMIGKYLQGSIKI
jgi:hypothetical protein